MQLAYYPGCSLKQSAALLDKQTRLVFESLGIHLREIKDWNCCGATSASKTNPFMEVAMPARNIAIAENAGFSEMVIPCSACYSKTLLAKARCNEDPELKEAINSELKYKLNGNLKILSILEPLLQKAQSGELAEKLQRKLKGLKAACYYGCMLTRFPKDIAVQDNVENPQSMEKILNTLGCSCIDWNYKTACCGASAAMYDQDTCLNLMSKIFKDALGRGANCFVATCPVCQMNLDLFQDGIRQRLNIKDTLPVYFLTELVGWSLGFNIKELQIDRHFIESTALVKEAENNEQRA